MVTLPLLSSVGSNKRYLIVIVVVIVAIVGLTLFLFRNSLGPKIENLVKKRPTVELKTSYKNPFKKETQYVNPFEKYKNPFVTNR